jgi:hypothetical protein
MGTVVQILKTIPQTFSFVADRSLSVDAMWEITAAHLYGDGKDYLAGTTVNYVNRIFTVQTMVDSNVLRYDRSVLNPPGLIINYQMAKLCAQYITYIVWAFMMDSTHPATYIEYLKDIDKFLISLSSNVGDTGRDRTIQGNVGQDGRDPSIIPNQAATSPDLDIASINDFNMINGIDKTNAQDLVANVRLRIIRWWYLLYTWNRKNHTYETFDLVKKDGTTLTVSRNNLSDMLMEIGNIFTLVKSIDNFYRETKEGDKVKVQILVNKIAKSYLKNPDLPWALSSPLNEGFLSGDRVPSPKLDIRVKLRLDDDAKKYVTAENVHKTFELVRTSKHNEHIFLSTIEEREQGQDDVLIPTNKYLFGPFKKVYAQRAGSASSVASDLSNYIKTDLPDGGVFVLMGYGASGAGKTSYLVGRRDKGNNTLHPGVLVHLCALLGVREKTAIEFRQWYDGDGTHGGVTGAIVERDANETGLPDYDFFENYMMLPSKRKTSATLNNPDSSRGHMVAHITVTFKDPDSVKHIMFGDLAGFENAFTAGNHANPGNDALDPRMRDRYKELVQTAFRLKYSSSTSPEIIGVKMADKVNGYEFGIERPNRLHSRILMPSKYGKNGPSNYSELVEWLQTYITQLNNTKQTCVKNKASDDTKKNIENAVTLFKNANTFKQISDRLGITANFQTSPFRQNLITSVAKICAYFNNPTDLKEYKNTESSPFYTMNLRVPSVYVIQTILTTFYEAVEREKNTRFSSHGCGDVFSEGVDILDQAGYAEVLNLYADEIIKFTATQFERNMLVDECTKRNTEGNYIRKSLLGLREYISSMTNDTIPNIPIACMDSSMESLVATERPEIEVERVMPKFPFVRKGYEGIDENIQRVCLFGVVDVNNVHKWSTRYYPTANVIKELADALTTHNICFATSDTAASIVCDNAYKNAVKTAMTKFNLTFSKNTDLTNSVSRIWQSDAVERGQPSDVQRASNKSIDIIENHNEGTPVGVLEFLDRMAKFGRIDRACVVDDSIAVSLADNEYIVDALNLPADNMAMRGNRGRY